MQDNHLFEYAVVRVVPRVEREEFLNAGVILYCAKLQFLQVKINLDEEKLQRLSSEIDLREVWENLQAFQKISSGEAGSGPIGKLPIAERFRWLTATRSTVVQSSKVHPGFCEDPADKLAKLFEQLVL